MSTMASQITSLTIVYSTVYLGVRVQRPISGRTYLFFRRQFHAIVIFRRKSISGLDSRSLPRLFGEFIYAKLKIVVS